MLVSNWIIFGAAEAYALLIVLAVFLLFHTRNLKNLVMRLQLRLQEVLTDLKKTKAENLVLQQQPVETFNYADYLDTLLQDTRDHHASLQPDRDIVLDLTHTASPARQSAAFRFATLVTEKEAVLASGGKGFDWGILELKFQQLVQLLTGGAQKDSSKDSAAELQAAQARIANLEQFQALFFEMEEQWQEASRQADDYYQQLCQMQVAPEQQADFDVLLEQYHNAYQPVSETIIELKEAAGKPKVITSTIEIVKTDERSLRELKQLRSVAADQHRLINELQQRLQQAKTPEAKDSLIRDLQKDLERQLRFITEAETCVQLLEQELAQAHKDNQQLRVQLQHEQKNQGRLIPLRATIATLEQEQRQLKRAMQALEQENHQLADHIQAVATGTDEDEKQVLQQEINSLKAQYSDMERRYLELRTRS